MDLKKIGSIWIKFYITKEIFKIKLFFLLCCERFTLLICFERFNDQILVILKGKEGYC